MRQDDVNDLNSVALNLVQATLLGRALIEYDGPKIYWAEDSDRSEDFRNECAEEIFNRMDRAVKRSGLRGITISLDEEEYRVCIEALVQMKDKKDFDALNPFFDEIIKHLQYFQNND